MIQCLIALIALAPLSAAAYDSVTFISKKDHFTVTKSAHSYTVDGKPVPGHLMAKLKPLLTDEVKDECPDKLGKPDVTAEVTTDGKAETRQFFIDRGVIRSDKFCLAAGGDGLFSLPLHRDWLIGPTHENVTLKSPLVISAAGQTLANLTKKSGEWSDTQPQTELDWDFFAKFEHSLQNFKVVYRLLPQAAAGKNTITVKSGSDSIKLVELSPNFWAIQTSAHPWLTASDDWTFWGDMDNGVWLDKRAPTIRQIEAAGAKSDEKLTRMRELEAGWSRTLEDFYHRRLLDSKEDMDVRIRALERLRNKPSWRNLSAEMSLLEQDPPEELLKLATQALRARNPKGLVFEPGTSDRTQVISSWKTWWEQNKNRKD